MKKVLIINDSGFERMVLRDQIQILGYEVKTADEFNGLSFIERYHPDIVIANLTMTDTTGDKLIRQIKHIQPATRCFLSTCSKNMRYQFDDRVIDGVLETPADMERLGSLLNHEEAPDFLQPKTEMTELPLKEDQPQNNENNLVQRQVSAATPLMKETDYKPFFPQSEKPAVSTFSFCPYCGEKLERKETKYVFCPFCGSRL